MTSPWPAAVSVAAASILVTGSLWWGTTDLVADGDPHNRAAELVPADGRRTLADGDQGFTVREDARLTGAEMVTTSPPHIGGALATLLDGDPGDWRIWRATQTRYDIGAGGSPEQSTTLRRLTDAGIEQVAVYGALSLVFEPPLLEIPADVRDGSTWSTEGAAQPDGGLTYASEFEASESDRDGCVEVTGKVVFSAEGEELLSSPTDETWCDGAGIVADGEPPDPPAFAGSTTPGSSAVRAADVGSWQARDLPPLLADSVADAGQTGDVPVLAVDLAPAVLPDGGLAVANTSGDDVLGLTPVDGHLVRAWVGHPGGTVTSLGSSGEVTVAASTTREVAGYGPLGAWLWAVRLSDLVVAPPVAADDSHLVLTTLAGDVVVVDPADGTRAWRAAMSDQVRVSPATDGDHVAVADLAGRVHVWDTDSGETVWAGDGTPARALGIAGDSVVLLGGNAVQGYALRDGERRWVVPFDGHGSEAVVDLGATVVASAEDETVGIEPDSGQVRWRAAGASATVAVGSVLVQVVGAHLVALDPDGRELGEWSLASLSGGITLTATATGVLATDRRGQSVVVGP